MTSTIDLSQPDFTYCKINDTHKHSEYIRMQKLYESDKKFSERFGKAVHEFSKKRNFEGLEEEKKLRRSESLSSNVLLKNSIYQLPDVKHLNRKHFVAKADMENKMKMTDDTIKNGKARVTAYRTDQLQYSKNPNTFDVKNALRNL